MGPARGTMVVYRWPGECSDGRKWRSRRRGTAQSTWGHTAAERLDPGSLGSRAARRDRAQPPLGFRGAGVRSRGGFDPARAPGARSAQHGGRASPPEVRTIRADAGVAQGHLATHAPSAEERAVGADGGGPGCACLRGPVPARGSIEAVHAAADPAATGGGAAGTTVGQWGRGPLQQQAGGQQGPQQAKAEETQPPGSPVAQGPPPARQASACKAVACVATNGQGSPDTASSLALVSPGQQSSRTSRCQWPGSPPSARSRSRLPPQAAEQPPCRSRPRRPRRRDPR